MFTETSEPRGDGRVEDLRLRSGGPTFPNNDSAMEHHIHLVTMQNYRLLHVLSLLLERL